MVETTTGIIHETGLYLSENRLSNVMTSFIPFNMSKSDKCCESKSRRKDRVGMKF